MMEINIGSQSIERFLQFTTISESVQTKAMRSYLRFLRRSPVVTPEDDFLIIPCSPDNPEFLWVNDAKIR